MMLEKAGWPVLKPLGKSVDLRYPLLLYPVVSDPALFDIQEEAYITGTKQLTQTQINQLAKYNLLISEKEIESIRIGTTAEAINAPIQTLFLKRFEEKGRIDQWYKDDTQFLLPGLDRKISWKELLDLKWVINGASFDSTLRSIITQARKRISFKNEQNIALIISHGDDHAGNVRLTTPPTVFDPAFAGWNPASLDLKALAHTGFLPMAAMYYYPKGLKFTYQIEGNKITVQNNMIKLPNYSVQEELAKQIIDLRIIPLLKAVKEKIGDLTNDVDRVRCGLAGCALLTVNVAKLLEQNDGRAIGLLPMAIMFSELKGLPMLDYLNQQLQIEAEKKSV